MHATTPGAGRAQWTARRPRPIALVSSSFAPHVGGVEEHVRQVARELRALGDTVEVWTVDRGTGPAVREVDAETAKAAGMPFYLFTEGYRKSPVEALPHQTAFSDFTTLPALIASHSR